jgi:hypothetical protein
MTIGAEEGQRAERRERVCKMTSRIYGAEVREYKPYVKTARLGSLLRDDYSPMTTSQKMSALHIGAPIIPVENGTNKLRVILAITMHCRINVKVRYPNPTGHNEPK